MKLKKREKKEKKPNKAWIFIKKRHCNLYQRNPGIFFLCPGTRADAVCTGTADFVFDFGGLVLDKDGGKTGAEVSGSFAAAVWNSDSFYRNEG